MNAPAPASPDDGSGAPSPWREIFGDYARVAGRRFRDHDRIWTVVAVTPEHLHELGLPDDDLSPELARGWLSFESGSDRRRLAPIPSGWDTVDDGELVALCRRAVPAGRVPR